MARGLGFDLRDKNLSRDRGIMIYQRIGSLPYELNWIACIPLLLLLFGKQVEDCLSVWLLGHALKKTTVSRRRRYRSVVLASDEPLHFLSTLFYSNWNFSGDE